MQVITLVLTFEIILIAALLFFLITLMKSESGRKVDVQEDLKKIKEQVSNS